MAILTAACSAAYKGLKPVAPDSNCLLQFKPAFTRTLYNTQVNILKHHLSGILLIKQMPDSSTRLLFSTETGFKFFDFEFSKTGDFKVYAIIDKMNKAAVIKTLRKDFEIALMINIPDSSYRSFTKEGITYHRFTKDNGYYYYLTDSSCKKLTAAEQASEKKTISTITMLNYVNGIPDTIGITHHNVKFNIGLKNLPTIEADSSAQQ